MARFTRLAAVAAVAATAFALSACAPAADDDGATDPSADTVFMIASGADNPLEGGVLAFVRDEVAADYGITIETRELQDSRILNESLSAGEIDGHVAIHEPYLNIVLEGETSWDLAAVAPIYTSLVTLASTKHDTIEGLPQGALIAIPDDPVNGAAALNVLQQVGLIELDSSVKPAAFTIEDIVKNEKEVTFVPAGAAQLARSVEDADLAFLPTSFLRAAGYDKSVEVVTMSFPDDYAIQLVVRGIDAKTPGYEKLIAAFKDPRVADYVDGEFGDIATGIRE